MSEFAFASANQLASAIRTGMTSSTELLEMYISRVERHDERINAVVIRDFDRARAAAREADAAQARGEDLGPLHGVPMTVKESFNIAGLKTCWGVPEMRDNVAAEDSVVVQRLKSAGAVIFGKTNIPIFLADFQSYNEVYGTTHNPWRQGHTPGGSSGGGAAALAAGFSGLEFGSDIGGSIRNPAHYSGVFGHKPTYGIIPLRGHSLAPTYSAPDISVVGPLARSADDLRLALDLTMGEDRLHQSGVRYDLAEGVESAKGLRVALWLDDTMSPVDDRVKERVSAAANALADAGAIVDDAARPDFSAAECHEIYMQLLHAALAARQPDSAYADTLARANALSDDDGRPGSMLLRAQTMRHRDWIRLNERRAAMRWAWADFFDRYDVLLCPVAAVPAFPHDESEDMGSRTLTVNGQSVPYFDQLFWAGMTGVSYLPGTMYPAGPASDGLPVGVQIVGPEMGDRKTIAVARILENIMGGFQQPPGFD
jgi:amidase